MLHLLDTLPSFPANLSYQSNSPIICGFAPEAYAQPWLGLHSLNLAHTPSFDSHRKAKDVLKEAIIQSTGGGAASTARTGPSASTSTAPTQIERDAEALPLDGLPLTSSSAVHSPSKCRCQVPFSTTLTVWLLSSGEGSASERGSRGSHSSSSSSSGSGSGSGSGSESQGGSPARSEASAGVRSVHSQTASVGSVEVLSGDEASGGEDDVLDSANEADVSQGSMSLLDISTTDDEDTRKCKARELARKSDTDFAAWKDKLISEGVKGIQEWDSMVNDYTDGGKRRPKNPDPLGPPISYMKERGVFQPLPSMTNPLGLCHFYRMDPASISTLSPPKPLAMVEHLKVSFSSQKHSASRISSLCSKVAPLLHWGYCRNCIHGAHLLAFQSTGLMKPRTGTSHACPVAHSVRTPSRMIQAYLNHIVGMHYNAISCVGPASVP